MTTKQTCTLLYHIHRMAGSHAINRLTDGELLQRFVLHQEEDAFGALVQRHGRVVWGVCQHLLHSEHDAEDAFQATFLVLARRAATIRKGEAVSSWLYGVAYRVARRARNMAAKRKVRERQAGATAPGAAGSELAWRELQGLLDEEVQRLPTPYRAAFVLCCLEGRSRKDVAVELGLKEGTLSSRIAQARRLLQMRLARRGVALSAALTAAELWGQTAAAAVPAALEKAVAGQAGALKTMSASVIALAEGVMKTGAARLAAVLVPLALALLTVGAGLAGYQAFAAKQPQARPKEQPKAALEVSKPPTRPEEKRARTDRHGDSLPPRAVARLGTVRFRSDSWVGQVKVVPGRKQLLGLGSRAVILWDASTGREIRRFEGPAWRKMGGTHYSVRIESFAVSPDGKTLAAGTSDGARLDCPILLFDLATGRKLREWPAHRGNEFSANPALTFVTPALLVSAGADSSIRVWDLTSKCEARRLKTPDKGFIAALVPSPDRKYVFGAGSNGKAGWWAVWEVATGKVVRREDGLPGHFVKGTLSPDGKALAVAIGVGEVQKKGGYNEVRLYSAPAWKEQRRWRTHAGRFPQRNSVAFAPDGTRIATGGADQKARQWDAATGRAIGPAIEPYWYANNVAYLDADTLITFGSQQAIKFWDATRGKAKLDFVGSAGHLAAVAYSPDGRHVATGGGGGDATVRVWESATGKQVAHLRGSMADVTCVQFSPDGKVIASASSDGVARLWDWMAGREVRAFRDHKGWLHGVAFSPDGKQLATGDDAGVVRVWRVADGGLVRTLRGHTAHVTALVFTPDGRTLLSGSWDHSIRHWDLASAKEIFAIKGFQGPTGRRKPVGHTSCVTSLALSAGGRRLFSGSYDHTICVWEMSSGQLCRVLKGQDRNTNSSVHAISLSPDGRRLAAAIGAIGQDSSVHVWDVLTGKKIGSLPGHRGEVTRLAFSPDGRRLASCSVDTTALIWDVTGLGSGRMPRNAKAVAAHWDDLGAGDPVGCYDAVCRGVAAGDAAVAVLKTRLKPVATVEPRQVAEWVRQLDSPVFQVRQRASQALADLGPAGEALLRKALKRAESVEVKARLKLILRKGAPERRRSGHAVEVLEMVGTQAAKRLLADLAGGAADARLTREALVSLKRLARKFGENH